MTLKSLPELRAHRATLLKNLWEYAHMPRPSGDGANDALDGEIAAMERELADVERDMLHAHADTLRVGVGEDRPAL